MYVSPFSFFYSFPNPIYLHLTRIGASASLTLIPTVPLSRDHTPSSRYFPITTTPVFLQIWQLLLPFVLLPSPISITLTLDLLPFLFLFFVYLRYSAFWFPLPVPDWSRHRLCCQGRKEVRLSKPFFPSFLSLFGSSFSSLYIILTSQMELFGRPPCTLHCSPFM